ncbi:MAG: acetate kinase, partial [Polyangiaceae bacterium]|nr:acetate kinase [Polyangiaceae bacterium]
MAILVLNSGSSSVKFALVDAESGDRTFDGIAERLGTPGATFTSRIAGQAMTDALRPGDHRRAVDVMIERLRAAGQDGGVRAIGHRVVH